MEGKGNGAESRARSRAMDFGGDGSISLMTLLALWSLLERLARLALSSSVGVPVEPNEAVRSQQKGWNLSHVDGMRSSQLIMMVLSYAYRRLAAASGCLIEHFPSKVSDSLSRFTRCGMRPHFGRLLFLLLFRPGF